MPQVDGHPGDVVGEVVFDFSGRRYVYALVIIAAHWTDIVNDVGDDVIIDAAVVVVGEDAGAAMIGTSRILRDIVNEIVLDHAVRAGGVDADGPLRAALGVCAIDLEPVDGDVAAAVIPRDVGRRIRR